jgi:hypothetical protein
MEKIFKSIVLLGMFVFLFLYYQNTQNNRFQLKESEGQTSVFDTRSGSLYVAMPRKDNSKLVAVKLNWITGKTAIVNSDGIESLSEFEKAATHSH